MSRAGAPTVLIAGAGPTGLVLALWLTPPAGPEKMVLIGRRRAVSVVIMPPLEATVRTPCA